MRWSVLWLVCVASSAWAGAVDGPLGAVDRVDPSKTDVFHVSFAASAIATVRLEGDHATDLDLAVLDAAGNPIAADTAPGDVAYLSFVPARTGIFVIKVQNKGATANRYALTTN